jgi:hypothetical protein
MNTVTHLVSACSWISLPDDVVSFHESQTPSHDPIQFVVERPVNALGEAKLGGDVPWSLSHAALARVGGSCSARL